MHLSFLVYLNYVYYFMYQFISNATKYSNYDSKRFFKFILFHFIMLHEKCIISKPCFV